MDFWAKTAKPLENGCTSGSTAPCCCGAGTANKSWKFPATPSICYVSIRALADQGGGKRGKKFIMRGKNMFLPPPKLTTFNMVGIGKRQIWWGKNAFLPPPQTPIDKSITNNIDTYKRGPTMASERPDLFLLRFPKWLSEQF